ncbi:MAG: tRNA threonylcarbamoyladenosine dehydratase [Myxococcales bacterium]|nr:tRNA threonylcarbamoyladenosine dehydratase [Myxococcales bacterium]
MNATETVTAAPPLENVCEVPVEDRYYLHRRFDRMGRLVGDQGMGRLFASTVMVIGLGGVGSWAAESLMRSGVGRLVVVDFDAVCVTNTNRQLQAMRHTVGKPKAAVLSERLRQINPQAEVIPIEKFYNADSSDELLDSKPDFVVDAIDNVTAKCHLLAHARERGIPIVSSGGASGRMDPTQIRTADLADTSRDPLTASVRKILRQQYGFPSDGPFDIPAVYSLERPTPPVDLHYDQGKGFRCVCPGGANEFHSCERRSVIYGTSSFVTGAFGLACASLIVRSLTSWNSQE